MRDATSTTPEAPTTKSAAAEAFERFYQMGLILLPATDCYASAEAFCDFCRSEGLHAEHVFVEFKRGSSIVEHYMAFFPDEQVAYDLAPQNGFKDQPPHVENYLKTLGAIPPEGTTHVVYTPARLAEFRWALGMNGQGWPGLLPTEK